MPRQKYSLNYIFSSSRLDTHIEVDDIVHIILDDSTLINHGVAETTLKQETYHINDKQNLIIVNPDLLLTGTSVVNTLFCMRKLVLFDKRTYGTQNINICITITSVQ